MRSQQAAAKIRALSLRLVHKAQASHIGSALSIADLLAVLIADDCLCNLPKYDDPLRDRIFLSKGHACVALYSALCLKGFFSEEEVMTYGEDFSPFMNHASHYVPGVEMSTGALGHALPVACGRAYAAKLKKEDWHTFVIMSDGELQEGSNWEALMFAAHHSLNNLTICIDYNNLQSLDTVDNTLSLSPLSDKLSSFGWKPHVVDGHNHASLAAALYESKASNLPSAVIMNTCKGKGVSYMERSVAWHYKSPNDSQLAEALREVLEQ
jgi:transketolase